MAFCLRGRRTRDSTWEFQELEGAGSDVLARSLPPLRKCAEGGEKRLQQEKARRISSLQVMTFASSLSAPHRKEEYRSLRVSKNPSTHVTLIRFLLKIFVFEMLHS